MRMDWSNVGYIRKFRKAPLLDRAAQIQTGPTSPEVDRLAHLLDLAFVLPCSHALGTCFSKGTVVHWGSPSNVAGLIAIEELKGSCAALSEKARH